MGVHKFKYGRITGEIVIFIFGVSNNIIIPKLSLNKPFKFILDWFEWRAKQKVEIQNEDRYGD